MKASRQQRKDAYRKLPVAVQNFASEPENMEIISGSARRFNLSEKQQDVLDSEVYDTIIGLQTVDQLSSVLEKELGLSPSKSLELIVDLNGRIFKKLESLRPAGSDSIKPISSAIPSTPRKTFQPNTAPAKPLSTQIPLKPKFDKIEINPAGQGLIEDAKGNADNVFPQREVVKPVIKDIGVSKPVPVEYKMSEGEPNILKEKFVPPNLPTGKETPFEKKIAEQKAAGPNQIVKQSSPYKIDPYRETLN